MPNDNFDAQTAVERELVLRLASLLWRLRRAIAAETGLLHMHAEGEAQKEDVRSSTQHPLHETTARFGKVTPDNHLGWSNGAAEETASIGPPYQDNLQIAGCFLRLADLDNGAFDRLHRYETALWRQVGQLLCMLGALQRASGSRDRRPFLKNSFLHFPRL
jgi:hypothetical protein